MSINEKKLRAWIEQTDKKLEHLEANQMAILDGDFQGKGKSKKPLIDDGKIRKAVRAWAEVLNIEDVSIEHRCAGELCEVHSVFCGLSMEFDGSIMSDIQDGEYTIAELCGVDND